MKLNREIHSMKENGTWEITSLPKGAKALPCGWVFRVKVNPDRSTDKYKARLVIREFHQRQGIDYEKNFSPGARMSTIRSVLTQVEMS